MPFAVVFGLPGFLKLAAVLVAVASAGTAAGLAGVEAGPALIAGVGSGCVLLAASSTTFVLRDRESFGRGGS